MATALNAMTRNKMERYELETWLGPARQEPQSSERYRPSPQQRRGLGLEM